jgi:hypothetical protein
MDKSERKSVKTATGSLPRHENEEVQGKLAEILTASLRSAKKHQK